MSSERLVKYHLESLEISLRQLAKPGRRWLTVLPADVQFLAELRERVEDYLKQRKPASDDAGDVSTHGRETTSQGKNHEQTGSDNGTGN